MRGSIAVWAMLTILLLSALLPAINMAHATNLSLASGTTVGTFQEGESSNSTAFPLTPPTIQDFLINNTATGNTTQFSFYVSDSVALQNCTFSNDNGTGTWSNSSLQLSGTGPVYANFSVNSFYVTTLLNFTFWLWNTNSSLVEWLGYRTLAIYNTSMPFTSLGNAITAVQGVNNWETTNVTSGYSGVDPYQGLVLNQNTTTQYESLIDDYATPSSSITTFIAPVYCTNTFESTGWNNPSWAYDGNTATAATYTVGISQTTNPIGFDLSDNATSTTIQYLVNCTGTGTTMAIYCGNTTALGTQVWSGSPTLGVMTNQTFTSITFCYMEIEFTLSARATVYLNETKIYSNVINTACPAYASYLAVLQYCAYANKLNITNNVVWPNFERDIIYALGNISMIGYLPFTDSNAFAEFGATYPEMPQEDFEVKDAWALYGYYWANNSWVPSWIQTKWNIALAYNQFDSAVNYSVTNNNLQTYTEGLPLFIYGQIYGDYDGITYTNRYYDECAQTIEDYLMFYSLLNVTDALNKVSHWWMYLCDTHYSTNWGGYFKYVPTPDTSVPEFECEASFFLIITSIMKYYIPNIANYSLVLNDIGNRFLSAEWMSYQWQYYGNGYSNYVVVHEDQGNPDTRLENTLGAWQALLGCVLQMNSTYQNDMKDMLQGNTTSNNQPAWALLMSSSAGLWNTTSKLFHIGNGATDSSYATAEGEITMFEMGIIPGTSTVAFPLEELNYEYTDNIDPVLMRFNLNGTAHQITVPVVQAGTITFDYGQSPITYNFNSGGVYVINFTSSWNMISSITYQSALPSSLIYFYLPATPLAVNISPTSATLIVGQSELFTSNVSGGTSPYAYEWCLNGLAVQNATYSSWTFTPTSAGPYTVYMEVNDSMGAQATSNTVTVTVNVATHDVVVTDVTSYQIITGQGFCNNVTVTIANMGSYCETFNVTVYANSAVIATIANITLASGNSVNQAILWNTTGFVFDNYTLSAYSWPIPGENNTASTFVGGVVAVTIPGDVDGNGRVNMGDIVSLCTAFSSTPGQPNWNPNCDIEGNGRIDMGDIVIACANFGQHNP